MMDLQIINPITYPDWDNLILSHPDCCFFHSSAWAKVLQETYHYTPLYFSVFEKGNLLVLIPVMEIRSFLTGKRGVSLPFTDYCDPIFNGNIQFQDLLSPIIEYGAKTNWKYLELRSKNNLLPLTSPSTTYLGHALDLSEGEDRIFSAFRDSTKRNIKKSIKEGIEIGIFASLDSVKEFYRLNCLTRTEHGLPPQPYFFFLKLWEHIISKGNGFVVLGSFRNKNVAGGVYFHFGKRAVYKYGASDRKYQELRPNNLVMWEAIKCCLRNGYRSFCFGRTEPANVGLRQYKKGWGTDEHIINYYKYDLMKNTFMDSYREISAFQKKVFSKMPLPVLNIFGSLLYKHMG